MRQVGRLGLKQLRMRQYDPQLVIQLVKELAELWILDGGFHSHRFPRPTGLSGLPGRRNLRHSVRGRRTGIRVPPQRIREDANRAAGRPDVFDLPRRDPVVNRATAHTDCFAGLHDRKSLSVHKVSGVRSQDSGMVHESGPDGFTSRYRADGLKALAGLSPCILRPFPTAFPAVSNYWRCSTCCLSTTRRPSGPSWRSG